MAALKASNQQIPTTVQTTFVEVKAMSEDHAKRIASGLVGVSMEKVTSVMLLAKPRDAKTCKTDDYPTTGTRKWKTIYEVYAYGQAIPLGRNKIEHTNMELVQSDIATKTEAVKIAREMAVKHQLPMTVQIAQKLDTHDTTCADIEPKTGLGKFKVYYIV